MPYAAAKAAVIAMTQNLAVYCEPQGVRVSCLIPGPVMTGVMDTMTSWTEDCPMRGPGKETRLMMPEEVAVVLADVRGMMILVGFVYLLTSVAAWVYLRRTFNARLARGVPATAATPPGDDAPPPAS